MSRSVKKSEQMRVIEPRLDCEDYELAKALRDAGHPVLGVTTRGDRWWLAFGVAEGEGDGLRYYDATEDEMVAAVEAAKTVRGDPTPRLKAELRVVLRKLAELSAEPEIYAAEIADLEAKRASLKIKIAGSG